MHNEPFELFRAGTAPLIFLCDHAANALPGRYGSLGLEASLLGTHIAYDLGAACVTRALCTAYGATAILARWSRLLVDLNRGADDPTLIMKLSDGRLIPGNRDIDDAETQRRLVQFHRPYHDAAAQEIARAIVQGAVPTLIAMHSFTPVWKGRRRPWEVGVLWDRDERLAKPLIGALRNAGLVTGENEPYSGELENDCLNVHGTMNGLPHVLIEIRQDLIETDAQARAFAHRLKPILDSALDAMGPARIRLSRPIAAKMGDRTMDEKTRTELEAAVFRRLVAHLRERPDVQNIELMIAGGFCRNCLGDWYREAAAEKGIALEKDQAREIVYGMAPAEWKKRHQKDATPEQLAAFERSQKNHS